MPKGTFTSLAGCLASPSGEIGLTTASIGLQDASDRSAIVPHSLAESRLEDFGAADRALLAVGTWLRQSGYRFTAITPASHRRVAARPLMRRPRLQEIFGWSRSFRPADLPEDALRQLEAAGALEPHGEGYRSAVRFSSLGGLLFMHSAFPTEQADAVFFGPDTYRFVRAAAQCISTMRARRGLRILDVGAGSGAGGLAVAALLAGCSPRVVLGDINEQDLRFCRINSALNGVPHVAVIESDLYAQLRGPFDLIIANPPYLVDPLQRTYRHGGGPLGADLSLRIAEEGLAQLAPDGRLLLYTGSAIVDGVDRLHEVLRARLSGRARLSYEEIDPDVFGEELDAAPYDRADRIAVVVATLAHGPQETVPHLIRDGHRFSKKNMRRRKS